MRNGRILVFFDGVSKNRILDHYNKWFPMEYKKGKITEEYQLRITRVYDKVYNVTYKNKYWEQPDFICISLEKEQVILYTKENHKKDTEFPYIEILYDFVTKYKKLPKLRNKQMEKQIEQYQRYQNLAKALSEKNVKDGTVFQGKTKNVYNINSIKNK